MFKLVLCPCNKGERVERRGNHCSWGGWCVFSGVALEKV